MQGGMAVEFQPRCAEGEPLLRVNAREGGEDGTHRNENMTLAGSLLERRYHYREVNRLVETAGLRARDTPSTLAELTIRAERRPPFGAERRPPFVLSSPNISRPPSSPPDAKFFLARPVETPACETQVY